MIKKSSQCPVPNERVDTDHDSTFSTPLRAKTDNFKNDARPIDLVVLRFSSFPLHCNFLALFTATRIDASP